MKIVAGNAKTSEEVNIIDFFFGLCCVVSCITIMIACVRFIFWLWE